MSERLVSELHAYHDGELRGLRRWWLERRVAGNPAAQAELARIRELGAALRAQAEQTPAPDLWSAIVLQLPAALPAADAARGREGFGFTLPGWMGTAVAAGAVAVALLVMPGGGKAPISTSSAETRASAVQLLDTGRRPALILQDDAEATIILLLPKQKIAAEGVRDAVG